MVKIYNREVELFYKPRFHYFLKKGHRCNKMCFTSNQINDNFRDYFSVIRVSIHTFTFTSKYIKWLYKLRLQNSVGNVAFKF
jgi:hypothetical protein